MKPGSKAAGGKSSGAAGAREPWANLCESSLIARVRHHPHLYDTNHHDYKNQPKCFDTWNDIAREIGIPEHGRMCKERWRTLRDVYVRNRKLVMTGEYFKKKRTWRFFNQMNFLADYISHRVEADQCVGHDDVETVTAEDDTEDFSDSQEETAQRENGGDEDNGEPGTEEAVRVKEEVEWQEEDMEGTNADPPQKSTPEVTSPTKENHSMVFKVKLGEACSPASLANDTFTLNKIRMLLPKSLSHLPIQIRTTTGSMVKTASPPATSAPKLRLVDQSTLMERQPPEKQEKAEEERNYEKKGKKRKTEKLENTDAEEEVEEETPGTSTGLPVQSKNVKQFAHAIQAAAAAAASDQAEEEESEEREAARSIDGEQNMKKSYCQNSNKNHEVNNESDDHSGEDENNITKQCSQNTKHSHKRKVNGHIYPSTAECDMDADEDTCITDMHQYGCNRHNCQPTVKYCHKLCHYPKQYNSENNCQLAQKTCICCESRQHLSQCSQESTTGHGENSLENEEEQLFGRYVAAALRKLSSKSKSLAKIRIQQVLFHLDEPQCESKEDCKKDKQQHFQRLTPRNPK